MIEQLLNVIGTSTKKWKIYYYCILRIFEHTFINILDFSFIIPFFFSKIYNLGFHLEVMKKQIRENSREDSSI